MSEPGLIPAQWVQFQMSRLAPTQQDFASFSRSLGVDPEAEWYTPIENKMLILNSILKMGDEHYGHCLTPIPVGTTELAFRVMNTAEDLNEAISLIEKFSRKVCPTRQISRTNAGDTVILRFEVDGLNHEHAAACELTIMLMYMFGLAAFVGEFIPIKALYSKARGYASYMQYNKDADCPVLSADFTGIEFPLSCLDLPKRAGAAPDPVSNAIRWGLLADKVRPIIDRNHLPLLNAVDLLKTAEAKARIRNVDERQKRRIARDETEYTLRDLEKSIKAAKAMVLIATTDKTISQIGFELDYSDDRSFRRFFQDVVGCSPLEYRNVYQDAAASEGRNHFKAIMEAASSLRDS